MLLGFLMHRLVREPFPAVLKVDQVLLFQLLGFGPCHPHHTDTATEEMRWHLSCEMSVPPNRGPQTPRTTEDRGSGACSPSPQPRELSPAAVLLLGRWGASPVHRSLLL